MEEAIGQFFSRAWGVYEKVVEADYLSHRLLYDGLRKFLQGRSDLRVLELGCGDARASEELLREMPVQSYLGIDSSQGALALARARVQGDHWRFLEGDVRQLPSLGQDWTVALASFCLHHLSPEEKCRTLGQIRATLGPSGVFLLVDVFRQEGQSRELYLELRRAWMRSHWSALSAQELELVMEHEQAADFPETLETYRHWASQAGFARVQESLSAPDGMHRWLTFSV